LVCALPSAGSAEVLSSLFVSFIGTTASGRLLQNVPYCEAYVDGIWACKLTRTHGYVGWAVWNIKGTSSNLPVPGNWGLVQYRDWENSKHPLGMTVPVDQMPVLLENKDGF